MKALGARVPWAALRLVAAGGALGASARYAIGLAWPATPGAFPWATFTVNVSGCLLMGALMVVVTETRQAAAWVRPFLGVGVLGGFTTFSTYAVDGTLLAADPPLALAYLGGTLVSAVAAVGAGTWLARAVTGRRR